MIKIIDNKNKISKNELRAIAEKMYGDLVKAVVDIRLAIIAIGGELHADEEAFLLEKGSKQENLWGINFYPDKPENEWIEFDSMINLRPWQGNRSRGVDNIKTQGKIKKIIQSLFIK